MNPSAIIKLLISSAVILPLACGVPVRQRSSQWAQDFVQGSEPVAAAELPEISESENVEDWPALPLVQEERVGEVAYLEIPAGFNGLDMLSTIAAEIASPALELSDEELEAEREIPTAPTRSRRIRTGAWADDFTASPVPPRQRSSQWAQDFLQGSSEDETLASTASSDNAEHWPALPLVQEDRVGEGAFLEIPADFAGLNHFDMRAIYSPVPNELSTPELDAEPVITAAPTRSRRMRTSAWADDFSSTFRSSTSKDEIREMISNANETWFNVLLPELMQNSTSKLFSSREILLDALYETSNKDQYVSIRELRLLAHTFADQTISLGSIRILNFIISFLNKFIASPSNREELCSSSIYSEVFVFVHHFCNFNSEDSLDAMITSTPEYASEVVGTLQSNLESFMRTDALRPHFERVNGVLEGLKERALEDQLNLELILQHAIHFLDEAMHPYVRDLKHEDDSPFAARSSDFMELSNFTISYLEREVRDMRSLLISRIEGTIALRVIQDFAHKPLFGSETEYWNLNSENLTLTPTVNVTIVTPRKFAEFAEMTINHFMFDPFYVDSFIDLYLNFEHFERGSEERDIIARLIQQALENPGKLKHIAMRRYKLHMNEFVAPALNHNFIVDALKRHFRNHYKAKLPRAFGRPFGMDYFTLADIEEVYRFYMHLVEFVSDALKSEESGAGFQRSMFAL